MESDTIRAVSKIFWCVIIVLALFLGANLWRHSSQNEYTPYDGDLAGVRYIVTQLAEGVTDLNTKQSRLQHEMDRLTEQLAVTYLDRARAEVGSRTKDRGEDNYYDKVSRDFALESAGARVVGTGATVEYVLYDSPVAWILHSLTSALCRGCDGARTMLQPGTMPGECWAFRGSRGEAAIQLLGSVNVTGVSVEHIPADVAPTGDISSAPRRFQLEGLDGPGEKHGFSLGTFEYDRDGRPNQYFEVLRPSPQYYNVVRLRFLSNWGHPVYTCVYRVRVHGDLAPGQSYLDRENADLDCES